MDEVADSLISIKTVDGRSSTEPKCAPRIQCPRAPMIFNPVGGTAMLQPLTMKHAEAHWLVSSMPNQSSANGMIMRVSASLLGVHPAWIDGKRLMVET